MTREEVKAKLPIIKAFAEGKTIQIWNESKSKWVDLDEASFSASPDKYRIKPKPKYRPFKNREECWQEMQKHQPFGWIICKTIGNYYNIEFLYSNKDNKYGVGLNLYAVSIDFETMFEGYNFADGTPFGIKED